MSQDRQAKIQAAAKGQRTGANPLLVGGVVLIVAVVVVVAGVVWSSQKDAVQTGGPPPGTQMGQPFDPYPDAPTVEGAPTLDVYEDFRCPACKLFEQAFGQTVGDLAQEGKIELRVHLKTVIDSNFGQEGSSIAASSALCAADQGGWTGMHQWLFANQPTEPGEFTKDQLEQGAKAGGLSGDQLDAWQECSDAGVYRAYVRSVDDQSVKDQITSTPTIVVDGTQLSWGALVPGGRPDVAAFTRIVTSGEVPKDMVVS